MLVEGSYVTSAFCIVISAQATSCSALHARMVDVKAFSSTSYGD